MQMYKISVFAVQILYSDEKWDKGVRQKRQKSETVSAHVHNWNTFGEYSV